MTTLEAASCPENGISEWRVRHGIPAGVIVSSPDRLPAPPPDSPYWSAFNCETYDSLKAVADELAKLNLWKLSWLVSREASLALQRNSGFKPQERIEYPHDTLTSGGVRPQ